MRIKIVPVDPPPKARKRKLADAELHFDEGPLEGMRLKGFSIWATGNHRWVDYPIPESMADGSRREPLFGPAEDQEQSRGVDAINDVLKAYDEFMPTTENEPEITFVVTVKHTKHAPAWTAKRILSEIAANLEYEGFEVDARDPLGRNLETGD